MLGDPVAGKDPLLKFSRRSQAVAVSSPLDAVPRIHCDLSCTDTTGWEGFEDLERSALKLLDNPDAVRYVPDSKGSLPARIALGTFQEPSDPERWILTASSSEAYGLLFQLLCDPGDWVATPVPGYPLVDELGRFHDVSVRTIPLRRDGDRWHLDLGWTERRLREGARALVLIQPGNPTGWVLSPSERSRVLELCRTHGVPLISDEVFEAWGPQTFRSLADQDETLCFTLGGLSKLLGLPHLKLGWIRVSGPLQDLPEALHRLENLNDAVLSANTPVQCALPTLLERREPFQRKIRERLQANREAWNQTRGKVPAPFQVLEATSGWFGILCWSGPWTEQQVCSQLLAKGVKVQPGYLFDLPEAGLVVSMVCDPSALLHGLSVLVELLISLEP